MKMKRTTVIIYNQTFLFRKYRNHLLIKESDIYTTTNIFLFNQENEEKKIYIY